MLGDGRERSSGYLATGHRVLWTTHGTQALLLDRCPTNPTPAGVPACAFTPQELREEVRPDSMLASRAGRQGLVSMTNKWCFGRGASL